MREWKSARIKNGASGYFGLRWQAQRDTAFALRARKILPPRLTMSKAPSPLRLPAQSINGMKGGTDELLFCSIRHVKIKPHHVGFSLSKPLDRI
jgi:hypothetical protein